MALSRWHKTNTRPKATIFERLMALIIALNLCLVLFDLSYIPFRDLHLKSWPEFTVWYGERFKGIESEPITLGYLSADFHAHATATLIGELLETHDRQQFRVIGYSYGPDDGSSERTRLIKAVDQFVSLAVDPVTPSLLLSPLVRLS